MRKIFVIAVLFLIAIFASAQDKKSPQASDRPIEVKAKEAPSEVTISADEMKKLQPGADAAEMARLRYQNLGLQIEKAQMDLQRLKEDWERQRDESNAAFNRAKIKAGIPGDLLNEYAQGERQKDGSLKLSRSKADAPKQ